MEVVRWFKIVQGIVIDHQGILILVTMRGNGTVFFVHLAVKP